MTERRAQPLLNPSPTTTNVQSRLLTASKTLALAGQALSDAAIEAGFFDQSHMTRHFKKAFGLSPSRWCNPRKT
nr:helix-turn-helix domain-containing protein [Pseudomonas sp. R5(2019)]